MPSNASSVSPPRASSCSGSAIPARRALRPASVASPGSGPVASAWQRCRRRRRRASGPIPTTSPSSPPGDAGALGRWLRRRGYRPPDGLESALGPYVGAGYRFLVARVDAPRITFADDRAVLVPLQFRFRSEQVVLPVRLARPSGDRPHDLVVHVLARERMESANRDDVLVPTNLVARPPARDHLGEVYATILDRVLRRHPGAVVTEYAWDAAQCDSCPTRPLTRTDLATFGTDAMDATSADGFVLTRLHTWIDRPQASDLALEEGRPIAGGRGLPRSADRLREWVDRRAEANAFQARYAILRPWRGALSCAAPARGRWGPPSWHRRVTTAPPTTTIIPTGQLRRYLDSWAPVLRIPVRGDAFRTAVPPRTDRPEGRGRRSGSRMR